MTRPYGIKKVIEQDMKFKCDMCKYSSTEENNYMLHTERIHCQCAMCDVKNNSEKRLKLHNKESLATNVENW